MRKLLLLIAFASSLTIFGQQKVNVSKGNTSIIIFPDGIKDIKNGNKLKFSSTQSSENIVEINIVETAFPKEGTNLIVFTNDGSIYQIDLVLKDNLTNYINTIKHQDAYIKGKQSKPKSKAKEAIDTRTDTNNTDIVEELKDAEKEKLKQVKEACVNNEKRKKRIFADPVKSYNIIISLRDVAYFKDKILLFVDIRNKGGQSYDIENINFIKTTSETGDFRYTSTNDIIDVYHIHNIPKKIEGKDKFMFIAVLNKTSINQRKAITIQIKELGGERNLTLNISDQLINNPIKL